MVPNNARFVLASKSLRRIAYLQDAGFDFMAQGADIPEVPAPAESPLAYAQRVAWQKAEALAAVYPDLPILSADTDVVIDDVILGQPRDAAEATTMLQRLSGRSHQVISAVVLRTTTRVWTQHTQSEVSFAPLTATQIARYVATGEPLGKAGGYAIQGAAAHFISAVRGSYTGIVGLPMVETMGILAECGIYPNYEGVRE